MRVTKTLFIILVAVTAGAITAQASEPITFVYGPGHRAALALTLEAQKQLEKGDLAGARRNLDTAIQGDRTFYLAFFVRARLFLRQHKYEEAIQDCSEALHQDSTFAEAALLRAKANYGRGRYAESLKELDHVISIRPRQDAYARAFSDRAWLRASCPDRSFRNPQQAVKDATNACKLIDWRDEDMIDTLAIACAETGDFASAVRFEEKAVAVKGISSEDSKLLQEHLALFKQHQSRP